VRLFFWNQRRRYGKVLEPARLWGRSPKVFASLALLFGALDRRSSPIESTPRSFITVRVSQINWCAFCLDINSALALKRGGDLDKLAELDRFEASTLFSEREKAALAYVAMRLQALPRRILAIRICTMPYQVRSRVAVFVQQGEETCLQSKSTTRRPSSWDCCWVPSSPASPAPRRPCRSSVGKQAWNVQPATRYSRN
jgi:AhpD family alkylhydroperoxidase